MDRSAKMYPRRIFGRLQNRGGSMIRNLMSEEDTRFGGVVDSKVGAIFYGVLAASPD